jgi:ribonuclease J
MRKNKVRLIPLGGLGEIGKNSMLIEYGSEAILIDAGLMFPEEEMLGIDLALPDFTYLLKSPKKLLGIVLTHGHEDHIGALPYLLRHLNSVPILGTPLTLDLVQVKLEDTAFPGQADLREFKQGDSFKLGSFEVETVRVNHSIPDGVGLAIRTPVGLIVHSGDFKFDPVPINDQPTDLAKFAGYGAEGVLLLLSDSTNAEVPGFSLPERLVGETLEEIFSTSPGKIIAVSFASHIHRLQQIVEQTKVHQRKLAISGRSMKECVEIASRLGYLNVPDDLIIEPHKISKFAPNKVVVLCTGSQGEPLSALSLIAAQQHKHIQVKPGDTVVIAATPIPGNERAVARIIDRLYALGASVFYEEVSTVHVSGHAYREELKLFLNTTQPRYFVPIHGEVRHLWHHAEIAREAGVDKENIFVLENGEVLEVTPNQAYVKKKVESGVVYVDGLGVGDIEDVVLRDRQRLSQEGIVIVVVGINRTTSELMAGPEIISRGFIDKKMAKNLLEEAKSCVVDKIIEVAQTGSLDWEFLRKEIKRALSRFIFKKTHRQPMVIPIVIEV